MRGTPIGNTQPREISRVYAWLTTRDPSGAFIGRLFQSIDLETGTRMCTWPDGIEFANIYTGEQKRYEKGKLRDV